MDLDFQSTGTLELRGTEQESLLQDQTQITSKEKIEHIRTIACIYKIFGYW